MGPDYKHIGVCVVGVYVTEHVCVLMLWGKKQERRTVSGKRKVVAISTWIQGRLTETRNLAKHLKKGSEV